MKYAALPATSMLAVLARRNACVVLFRGTVAGVRGAAGAAVPTHRGIEVDSECVSGISWSLLCRPGTRSTPLSEWVVNRSVNSVSWRTRGCRKRKQYNEDDGFMRAEASRAFTLRIIESGGSLFWMILLMSWTSHAHPL